MRLIDDATAVADDLGYHLAAAHLSMAASAMASEAKLSRSDSDLERRLDDLSAGVGQADEHSPSVERIGAARD